MKKWIAYLLVLGLLIGAMPIQALAAEVESITLDQTELELCVGQPATLTAAVQPEPAAESARIWRSSDASVVKLTGSGKLLAVGEGEAVITVTAGGKSASCAITVTEAVIPKNAKTITVTTGAKAQLFAKKNYYSYTEISPALILENQESGTTTFYFTSKSSDMSWRVSMDGMITKAGYLDLQDPHVTALYTDEDPAPDTRIDYGAAGQENSSVAEDGVLLNINGQNFLQMSVGEEKTLKAYRSWELIQNHQNHIITPDFTYTILSGTDVVGLTQKDSLSNGDGDWMTLTALAEGVAVIEVTYDAIEITGGSYDGIYGASDPARTGLVVVQVGGEAANVDFGIDSFTSLSTPEEDHIPYDPAGKQPWDAEFDTLYFTESNGKLSFKPSGGTVTGASVSNDKGFSWTNLTPENGTYTATIVPGNNILRVTTAEGVAYQVVRGDRISIRYQEVSGASDDDGIIEAGETIRVYLDGLHTPIPKASGNYNPGYEGNADGYSPVHLNYTYEGESIHGPGRQYDFITGANYVQITLPDDGRSQVTLSDGYIGVGVLGWEDFLNSANGHRYIPDMGCGMLYGYSSFHTRSILPELTILLNSEAAPNHGPEVNGGAVTTAAIELGQNYAINPETLFADKDGDSLTYTVSVEDGPEEPATAAYVYTPAAAGTYHLTFAASDGEASVSHTITLTVQESTVGSGEPETDGAEDTMIFGLKPSEIAGYVTIGFEDKGIRVSGETGLRFPVALGTIIPATSVPFKTGENIAQVTLRLLDEKGIGYTYSGTLTQNFYLASIKNFVANNTPYDAMGEFDAGQGSGWMITHNGVFIDRSTAAFAVKDGDVIQWKYTCQLGKDIGDTYTPPEQDNNTNTGTNAGTNTGTQIPSGGTLQPAVPETTTPVTEPMTWQDIYDSTGSYLEALGTPSVNSVGGEWMVIGLIRSGREIMDVDAYYENVVKYVRENIDGDERLHRAKSTENARLILALTAIGQDVTNVDGHDLLAGLNDMAYIRNQGINGPIWTLIAFDSGNYATPAGDVSREALIQTILDAQLEDGGWALTGETSDPDVTGMALQALTPYYRTNSAVTAAIDVAIATLSGMQTDDGSYESIDGASSESVAQVIVALAALGIDADSDARFVKNGVSALDALCAFYVKGGGFRHIPDGELDGMATEQGYYALTAYSRMLDNKSALYDMTDVIDMGGDPVVTEPTETLPAETESAPTEPAPEDEDKGEFPWWIVVVLLTVGAVVVILVNRKKILSFFGE